MKLVSIIIPCYNYGWLLAETLDSVLAQSYTFWECLIIDDGSLDNTAGVAKSYAQKDPRFRYIYQANQGMSVARNQGLALAGGSYIQFLDADDLLVPHKLKTQIAFLEKHSDADLVYGDVRYFHHEQPRKLSRSFNMQDEPWIPEVQGEGEAVLNLVVEKNIMVMNSPLLRASLFDRVGLFAEGLRSMEDWEFWVRCALNGIRFQYDSTPDIWALVRVHPTSTSQNGQRMAQYEIIARQSLLPLLKQAGAITALKINEEAINNQEAFLAAENLRNGSLLLGVKRYFHLAFRTGRYGYYFKSIPYWIKVRISEKSD